MSPTFPHASSPRFVLNLDEVLALGSSIKLDWFGGVVVQLFFCHIVSSVEIRDGDLLVVGCSLPIEVSSDLAINRDAELDLLRARH